MSLEYTMNTSELMGQYRKHMQQIFRLRCISQLLDWDQQVNLPPAAASERGDQLELISTLIHQKKTSQEFSEIVSRLYDDLDSLEGGDLVNIRESKRALDREQKLPEEFVARCAKASSTCYTAWITARKQDDYLTVLPLLEKNIALAKEKIELVGYEDAPYDALLEDFEGGSKLSLIQPPLQALTQGIKELLPAIRAVSHRTKPYTKIFPEETQQKFCLDVAQRIGYSLEKGRIDKTHHPFMTTLGSCDKRITTRYDETNYLSGLLTMLHEAGHALYELGFLPQWAGTPMAEAVSLSIHESQSRIYENLFGRSKPFAHFIYSVIEEYFPEEHAESSPEHIWRQLNYVEPSLIRVEADEVTYSLHVAIRLELEVQLFNGTLKAKELPEAWNAKYKEHLGVEVPSNTSGVLQDVHWYAVGFGYFPTYALGNLYSAMMREQILQEHPRFEEDFREGEFTFVLDWLRTNVHRHGMTYSGQELAEKISGNPLSEKPFLSYIKEKFDLQ